MVMASERVRFWQKKLAENQQILDLIDAGRFQASNGDVPDEQATQKSGRGRHVVLRSVRRASRNDLTGGYRVAHACHGATLYSNTYP